MAKIIKYQLVTKIPHEVVVQVPLLDENGEPVMREIATPVTEEVEIILSPASISCKTQESFDKNLPIVLAEAYNEEYTVEGEFDPEAEPTTDEILNAMLGVSE